MKKKQAWKVMGAVLAGTLVFSDAVPLRASASSGTGTGAAQSQNISRTEENTETQTENAAVYVDLKKGDDTADGATPQTAVKTVEKAQELLQSAAQKLAEEQADRKNAGTEKTADTKTEAKAEEKAEENSTAVEKYLVFVGMSEKELENYQKKQQKTDSRGNRTDTVFSLDVTVVTETEYEAVLAAEKAEQKNKAEAETDAPVLAPGESPVPDVKPTAAPAETPDAEPTAAPTETPDADPAATPTETPNAEPTAAPTETPDAEPTVAPTETPDAEPTVAPTETPDAEPTVTPAETPDAEPTVTPAENPDTPAAPDKTPDEEPAVTPSQTPDDTDSPAETPEEKPTGIPDTAPGESEAQKPGTNPAGPEQTAPSDQWKNDENLDDLVKNEIEKENSAVKDYDEISNPASTVPEGGLISDVSLLIQPVLRAVGTTQPEPLETEPETEEKTEGEEELLAAAEQKSNLSADEMTASAAGEINTLRAAGTILVGPDNYGTNKTTPAATTTPTKAPSSSSSSAGGSGSSQNNSSSTGSGNQTTKIPQKKTQTTASIRSIPVNTGDETMVLPLAISSALSAAVMFCMAFLQMQAKRAKSAAAWLEFKKNHPFEEE